MQTDDLLLRRAQRGDQSAFEELIAPHEKRIYQIALRLMGNPDDALDQAQEAMLRVYVSLSKYRGVASLSTWIYRIATNVCLDELRRRKGRQAASLEEMAQAGRLPQDRAETPEQAAERRYVGETLQRALTALPDDQRAAIVLRDIQGLPYDEIAQILQTNINTIKSRIARARQSMRRTLAGAPELFEQISV